MKVFISQFGVPEYLTFDGAAEQCGKNTLFMKQVIKHDIKKHRSEPHRHNENAVEGVIREIRRRWYRLMLSRNIPRRLWDYGLTWICELMQRTVNSRFDTFNKTPFSIVLGDTPDISEYTDFTFWDWVWVIEGAGLSETILANLLACHMV